MELNFSYSLKTLSLTLLLALVSIQPAQAVGNSGDRSISNIDVQENGRVIIKFTQAHDNPDGCAFTSDAIIPANKDSIYSAALAALINGNQVNAFMGGCSPTFPQAAMIKNLRILK